MIFISEILQIAYKNLPYNAAFYTAEYALSGYGIPEGFSQYPEYLSFSGGPGY